LITAVNVPSGLAVSGTNLLVANSGRISQYNTSTGAGLNLNFITGLTGFSVLLVSGSTLYVANNGGTTVGKYNANTGATINANFITGLTNPFGLAISSLQSCTLQDTLSYNSSSGTLTTKFLIGNPTAVTWNAWLTYQNTIQQLFSVSQPITNVPKTVTQTTNLSPEGTVGVLSTLTTSTQGIVCSSWAQTNTGAPQ
jgi:hypothetical protein